MQQNTAIMVYVSAVLSGHGRCWKAAVGRGPPSDLRQIKEYLRVSILSLSNASVKVWEECPFSDMLGTVPFYSAWG
jgi:hypothetical protein